MHLEHNYWACFLPGSENKKSNNHPYRIHPWTVCPCSTRRVCLSDGASRRKGRKSEPHICLRVAVQRLVSTTSEVLVAWLMEMGTNFRRTTIWYAHNKQLGQISSWRRVRQRRLLLATFREECCVCLQENYFSLIMKFILGQFCFYLWNCSL